MTPILSVRGLEQRFDLDRSLLSQIRFERGRVVRRKRVVYAVNGISFDVPAGQIVTLIGANGAGKSTFMNALMGLVHLSEGTVTLEGRALSSRSFRVVRSGLSLVPEGRRIFAPLTVEENLWIGAFARRDPKAVREDFDWVLSLFPRLRERLRQYAGTLSGGEQQMLAIARALMARPRVLLLDEPSLGLAPIVIRDIFKELRRINEEGVSILLVEQNANMALSIAHRAYVMETGRITLQGAAKELAASEDVRKAYLGG